VDMIYLELTLLDLGQLQEMLLLLLPLLNSSSIRNLLSPFSKDKASSSAEDDTACPICLASPTIPFLALPCQHRYILTDIPPCWFSLKLLLTDILRGCPSFPNPSPHQKLTTPKYKQCTDPKSQAHFALWAKKQANLITNIYAYGYSLLNTAH